VPDSVRSQPAAIASHSYCLTHPHTLCVCSSYSCVTNGAHPGHAHFECQSGHWLSWLRFSMVFHGTTRCCKLGTVPQFRRLQFRFLVGSQIFHCLNPSGCTILWQKWVPGISHWEINAAGVWGWQPYHLHVLNV